MYDIERQELGSDEPALPIGSEELAETAIDDSQMSDPSGSVETAPTDEVVVADEAAIEAEVAVEDEAAVEDEVGVADLSDDGRGQCRRPASQGEGQPQLVRRSHLLRIRE